MSDTFLDYLSDVSRFEPEGFLIRKSNYAPTAFFKSNARNEVFIDLRGPAVTNPVYLNHYTRIEENEISYSPKTREWVLGSVRLSEKAYYALKPTLSRGWILVQVTPVTPEAHATPPEWGPVSP